jgi:hypothetical protein
MAYDTNSDRVVMFGGYGSANLGDTWEYDNETGPQGTWTQRTPWAKPSARYASAFAYDRESDRMVLHGGWTGAYDRETWAYDQNALDTVISLNYSKLLALPAGLYNVTFRIKAGSSGAPKVNITLDNATLDEQNVTANANHTSSLRISIGAGDHWLQVRGTGLTNLHLVRFVKIGTDPKKGDTDSDGLKDDEPYVHGTLPTSKDTDLDGLWDGREIAGQDITVNGQTTRGESSPVLADTDSDGLADESEWGKQLNESFEAPSSKWTKFGSSGTWSWGKDGT